jgi:hypothetical protein
MADLKAWAGVAQFALNWLNDLGFEHQITQSLDSQAPEVMKIFNWASPGGVLIEVPVQVPKVQLGPAPERQLLSSNAAAIVGAGTSAENTLAGRFTDYGPDAPIRLGLRENWRISPEFSRFLWITKDKQGYHFQRYDYSLILRRAGAIYASKELLAKLTFAQDALILMNMVDRAVKEEKNAEAKRTILSLQQSAISALKQLDAINKQLKDQLDAAARLNKAANTISAIGSVLSLASKIAVVQTELGSQTPTDILHAQSDADLNNAISSAEQKGQQVIEGIEQSQTIQQQNFIQQKSIIILQLKQEGAPVYLLP